MTFFIFLIYFLVSTSKATTISIDTSRYSRLIVPGSELSDHVYDSKEIQSDDAITCLTGCVINNACQFVVLDSGTCFMGSYLMTGQTHVAWTASDRKQVFIVGRCHYNQR